MPATGASMAAPFGRVTSGQGFAPTGYQAHDLPAAEQFTKDLPDLGRSQAHREAWAQQSKLLQGLQGLGRLSSKPNQIPSAIPGFRPTHVLDDVEVHHIAKRPRLMPDYGRSASDPPLSFQRRNAHAMNISVDALKMSAVKAAGAQLPKSLRSVQSGPSRAAGGRPSPNYRIYSNAFLGGRLNGDGDLLNYSQPKAAVSGLAPAHSAAPQQGRVDPTPHPALLRQPLVSHRSEPGSRSTAPPQGISQQPDQAQAAQCNQEKPKAADQKVQPEGHARLQSVPSVAQTLSEKSSSPQPVVKASSPQPESSTKHSASHTHSSPSDEDTELEEVSHVSHAAHEPAAAIEQDMSPRAASGSPRAASGSPRVSTLDRQGSRQATAPRVSSVSKAAVPLRSSPAPEVDQGGDATPTSKDDTAVGREAKKKRKSMDSKDPKASSRKAPLPRADTAGKGRPTQPWSNLSSALQPSVSRHDSHMATQLQALMADAVKKNGDHRQEQAHANVSEATIQQMLQQLSDVQGRASLRSGALSGISSQEQMLAGNFNLPRAPLQAQIDVMRGSFRRGNRPDSDISGFPPGHPAALSSFPPHRHDHHRGFMAPNQEVDMPRAGPAGSYQHHAVPPISSSTLSSLPPSVAAFYEHEQRQQLQQQQQQMSARSSGFSQSGLSFSHQQQLSQHLAQRQSITSMPQPESSLEQYLHSNGGARGYAQSRRPMESQLSSTGWNDTLGSDSGYRIPSRVVTMDAGGVRNPALLNRPVMASHRDPQANPMDQNLAHLRENPRQQGSSRASDFLNNIRAQHAQHAAAHSSRGPAFPSTSSAQQDAHSSLHALGAVLGNSNLSAAEMAQLCSYASTGHAGNLNQLITQLQMVKQLAQAQSEPAQPLVETTHRVVIPAAHLKEGSHAISRQTAAPLAKMRGPTSGATVADVGNRVTQHPPSRAVETALDPTLKVPSSLDVAAMEAANDEPSELLMLAAETLAGLNSMQPRTSPDHLRPASSSLDHPSNDSPAAARKLSKQLGETNRKQRHKMVQTQKATAIPTITTAAAHHASGGNASVHPILGFNVPHARRSYRSEPVPTPGKSSPSAQSVASETAHATGEYRGRAAAAPASGKQRRPGVAPPQSQPSFPRPDMERAGSDSSMTVSADST